MTTLRRSLACGRFGLELLFVLVLVGGASSVQAQWAWRDASGQVTYSDSPPPADVTRSDILRQPMNASSSSSEATPAAPGSPSPGAGGPTATSPRVATPAPTSPPAQQSNRPTAAPKTLAEQDADFRKRQAERQKAEEKEAEDETQASQRADACNQAKTYLDMLQGGTRLLRPDANGERNFMDDDQRSAEIQKTQEAVEKNC